MSESEQDLMPTASWWLSSDFYDRQKREQERIRLSRYGQAGQLITGVEAPVTRPKKPLPREI